MKYKATIEANDVTLFNCESDDLQFMKDEVWEQIFLYGFSGCVQSKLKHTDNPTLFKCVYPPTGVEYTLKVNFSLR